MKAKVFSAGVVVVFFLSTASLAQTWSEEQKEVWTVVDSIWKAMTEKNVDLVNDLIDESYRGWHSGEPAPKTKPEILPWMDRFMGKQKLDLYSIHPLAIDIYEDMAIVFYSSQMILVNADGTEMKSTGNMMDIYRNRGDKWRLIADYSE